LNYGDPLPGEIMAHESVLAPGARDPYISFMQTLTKTLAVAVAAVFAFGAFDDASAARKKRPPRAAAPAIERDYDGTPIIMKGFRRPPVTSIMKDEPGTGRVSDAPSRSAARQRPYRRGSGGYIPPAVTSSSSYSLPAPALLQPTSPGVYNPPPITTFSDRVNNAIHDFPLQRGIGNNPNDLQSFIRQRANQ
jgi:hypothetical protein